MKLIDLPKKGIDCWRCKRNIFQVTTPNGADYYTCPLCDGTSYDLYGYDDAYDHDFITDAPAYCETCNILFGIGCTHAVNGCTNDIYYASLVHVNDNNNIKIPQFDNSDEAKLYYKENVGSIKWLCLCSGNCKNNQCTKATYPNRDTVDCHCEINLIHIIK